jgi:tetratricopeptide (TPR) repeat protein
VLSQLKGGTLEAALKNAGVLLKNNQDPRQLYLLGVFYRYVSSLMYYQKDYNLKGFMEPNATNTEISLQLTAKWKECFFKLISVIDSEIEKNLQVETDLVLVKFMCEVRLRRFVDAANSLRRLQNLDRHGTLADYALLVYSAEKNTKQTEASVSKAIARDNLNAYYYLAKFLSQQKKLEEATAILQRLGKVSDILMAQELLARVRSTQEASRM